MQRNTNIVIEKDIITVVGRFRMKQMGQGAGTRVDTLNDVEASHANDVWVTEGWVSVCPAGEIQMQECCQKMAPDVAGLVMDLEEAGNIVGPGLSRWAVASINPWIPKHGRHLVIPQSLLVHTAITPAPSLRVALK